MQLTIYNDFLFLKKLHISILSIKKLKYIDRSDTNELKTYNYTLIHVIDIDISNKLIYLQFQSSSLLKS